MVIPEGMKIIGNHWFCGSEIASVEIPASVREIWVDAFFICKKLKSVVFAEGSQLEKIGSGSFCHTGIEKITIPKDVEEIQEHAFRECRNLKEAVFEAGSALKKIGNHELNSCTNLKNIRLPDGLETIGIGCLWYSGLEEITLPASVKSIELYAFYRCEY